MMTKKTRIARVGERVQNLLKGRKARLQGITEVQFRTIERADRTCFKKKQQI